MNYYNPYFFNMPTTNTGLFSRLFGNLKLSSIISGTSKTLNFVNQTIPVIKQIPPMIKNARTMFNVVNQFKKIDEPTPTKKIEKQIKNISENKQNLIDKKINQPNFFI